MCKMFMHIYCVSLSSKLCPKPLTNSLFYYIVDVKYEERVKCVYSDTAVNTIEKGVWPNNIWSLDKDCKYQKPCFFLFRLYKNKMDMNLIC